MAGRLTEKQRRFVDAYIETGNATESARLAGYRDKRADAIGYENLRKPEIQKAIGARMKELESKRIATAKEVLEFLTAVVRGEAEEDNVAIVGHGPGITEARIVKKKASLRDRLKAAELLAKRFGVTLSDLEVEEKKARIEALRQAADARQEPAEEVVIVDDTNQIDGDDC